MSYFQGAVLIGIHPVLTLMFLESHVLGEACLLVIAHTTQHKFKGLIIVCIISYVDFFPTSFFFFSFLFVCSFLNHTIFKVIVFFRRNMTHFIAHQMPALMMLLVDAIRIAAAASAK